MLYSGLLKLPDDGVWRIAQRTLRNDWSRIETIEATMTGSWVRSGRGGSPDPLDQ